MKKKVLLSSIVTIVLCLCLIAGSTFALFTDNTSFNIAVTSGEVEILATAEVSALYSAKPVTEAYTGNPDDLFRDENGAFYIHDNRVGTFTNGGTAEVVDGKVVIKRITPGDKVDIKINVANTSDVAISYRYKLVSDDTHLATGMKVTTFNKDGSTTATEALAIWTSDWYFAEAPAGSPEQIPTRTISVELPIYAGNEYQTKKAESKTESVEYTIIVEAVQGNANTVNEEKIVVYSKTPVQNVPPVLSDFFNPETNAVEIKDVYLQENANISLDQNIPLTLENITTDVNGSVIILDQYAPLIFIVNSEFNLDDGEYIVDASACASQPQIILVNVTVNGKLLEIGVCTPEAGQYLNNPGWYQVADPNLVS